MIETLAQARAADAADPLRDFRDRFVLPDGVLYFDGNSLGPLPRATARCLDVVLRRGSGARSRA
jgi:kynureninase